MSTVNNELTISQVITLNDDMNTLDYVLKNRLDPCPSTIKPLPIAHLTSARSFNQIRADEAFKPQKCDVFNQKLLYFSYGGIFHRYGPHSTQDATKLPVAFVFKPTLLTKIDYLFPYDTGAANKGLFNEEICNFDKYRISSGNNQSLQALAPKLVYYFYNSNENYIKGIPAVQFINDSISQIEVMQNLLSFLSLDLTQDGVDHRHRAMECQSNTEWRIADIIQDILWVGFPNYRIEDYYWMCEERKKKTDEELPKYLYSCNINFTPSEQAAKLEREASIFMQSQKSQNKKSIFQTVKNIFWKE